MGVLLFVLGMKTNRRGWKHGKHSKRSKHMASDVFKVREVRDGAWRDVLFALEVGFDVLVEDVGSTHVCHA